MNHSIEISTSAEVGIDRKAAAHCLTLLSPLEGAADAQLWPADAGVWNNVVIEAVTPQQTYYFKQYREFANIQNYSPPRIPAEQRASECSRRSLLRGSPADKGRQAASLFRP